MSDQAGLSALIIRPDIPVEQQLQEMQAKYDAMPAVAGSDRGTTKKIAGAQLEGFKQYLSTGIAPSGGVIDLRQLPGGFDFRAALQQNPQLANSADLRTLKAGPWTQADYHNFLVSGLDYNSLSKDLGAGTAEYRKNIGRFAESLNRQADALFARGQQDPSVPLTYQGDLKFPDYKAASEHNWATLPAMVLMGAGLGAGVGEALSGLGGATGTAGGAAGGTEGAAGAGVGVGAGGGSVGTGLGVGTGLVEGAVPSLGELIVTAAPSVGAGVGAGAIGGGLAGGLVGAGTAGGPIGQPYPGQTAGQAPGPGDVVDGVTVVGPGDIPVYEPTPPIYGDMGGFGSILEEIKKWTSKLPNVIPSGNGGGVVSVPIPGTGTPGDPEHPPTTIPIPIGGGGGGGSSTPTTPTPQFPNVLTGNNPRAGGLFYDPTRFKLGAMIAGNSLLPQQNLASIGQFLTGGN